MTECLTEVSNRLNEMILTAIHGPDDPFDLKESMSLVRSDLVASLHFFEVDDHRRAVGVLLEHLYLWLFYDIINRRVF